MSQTSRRRKPYPPLLARMTSKKAEGKALLHKSLRARIAERQALLAAVWEHFGLDPGNWQGLAESLLERHVPAFKRETRGKDKAGETEEEWRAYWNQGGTRSNFGEGVLAFVQAQFVLSVQAASQMDNYEVAYEELAKDENRQTLPDRYRKRKTPRSLKQAFLEVPKFIRDNPKQFIPGTDEYKDAERLAADEEARLLAEHLAGK
ncbi:MAG: hypothetical protein JWR80_472 [Bradyrhizobium sp.]|nr:hypothetical protein [Bradyrhizobium sp.]